LISQPPLEGILETCVYANDLEAAERFYRDVIGLDVYAKMDGRHVFFRCGACMFLVFNPETTVVKGTPFPVHGAVGPGHAAFEVLPESLDAWRARLGDAGVSIETEIDWPNGGHSIYFRDPAGNSIELATRQTWS
jgi:catechol 2,3-dioxygenase-like lactoylglutathione lyase family enzyme